MTEAFIYDAVRTPRGKGKKDGSLHEVTPVHLLGNLFHALQERNRLDTSQVDDVVLGCVTPVGEQGADIARTAVLYSGWAENVPGVTQSRFCASGLESVNLAAMKVMSGQEDLVVAGGVESMSRWPMGSDGGAWAMDPRVNHQLGFAPQGIGADLIASLEGFSRADVDGFAVRSQQRAARAAEEGVFAAQIVPVVIPAEKGKTQQLFGRDEQPRPDTSLEGLAKLKPVVSAEGTVTAGNASSINDGAAALLLASEAAVQRHGLKPLARVLGFASAGVAPRVMGVGPIDAVNKLLQRLRMKIGQFDVIELNEAFASQALASLRGLGLPDDAGQVNPNGGAIALGHPLGCSGARITGALAHILNEKDAQFGLATMCIGMGQGVATVLERVH